MHKKHFPQYNGRLVSTNSPATKNNLNELILPWHWIPWLCRNASLGLSPEWARWPGSGTAWTPPRPGVAASCTGGPTAGDSTQPPSGGSPARSGHCTGQPAHTQNTRSLTRHSNNPHHLKKSSNSSCSHGSYLNHTLIL